MKTKLLFAILALGVLCTNCTKEDNDEKYTISKADAIEIVRPLLSQWPDNIVISDKPIPAKKSLNYGPFGHYNSSNPNSGKTKSPNYRSWLIVRISDPQIDDIWESRHFFVNVSTGEVEEQLLYGYVEGITWDDDAIYRAFYGESGPAEYDDYSTIKSTDITTKSENTSSSNGN